MPSITNSSLQATGEHIGNDMAELLKDPLAFPSFEDFRNNLHPNNPRPSDSHSPLGDRAFDHWVFRDGSLATFHFTGIFDQRGNFTRIGPYLNNTDAKGNSTISEDNYKRIRPVFEIRPLTNEDRFADFYPEGAYKVSNEIVFALLTLESDLDEKRGPLPDDKRTHFTRTYEGKGQDRFVYPLIGPTIVDAGVAKREIPAISKEDIRSKMTDYSPSKLRKLASTIAGPSTKPSTATGHNDGSVRLRDMPDPEGLYSRLPDDLLDAKIIPPPVYDTNGDIIHPKDYDDALPYECPVNVEASLCVCEITSGGKSDKVTERRVYHMRLRKMQLLPQKKNNSYQQKQPTTPTKDTKDKGNTVPPPPSTTPATQPKKSNKRKAIAPQGGSAPKRRTRSSKTVVSDDEAEEGPVAGPSNIEKQKDVEDGEVQEDGQDGGSQMKSSTDANADNENDDDDDVMDQD